MTELRILELFSGIGGMHSAFSYSELKGKVVAAMDINTVANAVYAHNHPDVKVLNNNIQKLTPKAIAKMDANTILMSPPCQPFTRVGNQKDVDDSRTDALKHICDILEKLETVKYILMENVKGFETSRARDRYLDALKAAGFQFREFILSPSQFGVPNTRHRYYCLARKDGDFAFDGGRIWEQLPEGCDTGKDKRFVKDILDEDEESIRQSAIPMDLLKKRVWLMDIVTPEADNTMCFTKAYTHYSEGTGSVFTSASKETMGEIFKTLKNLEPGSEEYSSLLGTLQLRYFTPREATRLMSFPEDFEFAPDTTTRQKYRLLGNSINVLVIGELIKLLVSV